MSFRHMAIAALLVSALFLLTSCGSDSCTDVGTSGCNCGGEEEHARSTVEGTVEAFAEAMEEKDLDAYADCLTEDYLFEFTPQDAENLGLPPGSPWWGKTEDLGAMGGLFDDPYVSGIDFDIHIVDGSFTGDVYTLRCAPSLKVFIDDPDGGEGVTLWVYDSWLHFTVSPDAYEADLWQIGEIREEMKYGLDGGEGAATEPTTFGSIKAMYSLPS